MNPYVPFNSARTNLPPGASYALAFGLLGALFGAWGAFARF